MLTLQSYKNLNWSHQAIFTLLRSAANIFLMQTLGEVHELKSNMLEKEESIIDGNKGNASEKKMFKILEWFMHHEVSTSPIQSISFSPNISHNSKGTKHQKDTLRGFSKVDQDTPKGKKGI